MHIYSTHTALILGLNRREVVRTAVSELSNKAESHIIVFCAMCCEVNLSLISLVAYALGSRTEQVQVICSSLLRFRRNYYVCRDQISDGWVMVAESAKRFLIGMMTVRVIEPLPSSMALLQTGLVYCEI